MIPTGLVDFVFSFDSLVHADETVMTAYVSQLQRVLKSDGAAFLHHSNLGAYSFYQAARTIPKLAGLLARIGVLEKELHARDLSMTAKKVELCAEQHGLACISQEMITWGTKRALIDCLSIIVKRESRLYREHRTLRNRAFSQDAGYLSKLSKLYGGI